MAENVLDGFEVGTRRQGQGGGAVPDVMEADGRQPIALYPCPEVMGQVVRAVGPAVGVGEDEALGSVDASGLALIGTLDCEDCEDCDGGAVQGEGAGARSATRYSSGCSSSGSIAVRNRAVSATVQTATGRRQFIGELVFVTNHQASPFRCSATLITSTSYCWSMSKLISLPNRCVV